MPQMLLLTYFFLGWVGLGIGFTMLFIYFLTHQNLANRKHPIDIQTIIIFSNRVVDTAVSYALTGVVGCYY